MTRSNGRTSRTRSRSKLREIDGPSAACSWRQCRLYVRSNRAPSCCRMVDGDRAVRLGDQVDWCSDSEGNHVALNTACIGLYCIRPASQRSSALRRRHRPQTSSTAGYGKRWWVVCALEGVTPVETCSGCSHSFTVSFPPSFSFSYLMLW